MGAFENAVSELLQLFHHPSTGIERVSSVRRRYRAIKLVEQRADG
jgi:hypothetical protein